MAAISPGIVAMVAASIAAQVFGLFLLPLTRGLTEPLPTLAMAAAFLIGIGLMARMAHAGIDLSLLVPVMCATIPLGGIAVGILVYGEVASVAKIATLVLACIVIGVANIL